MVWYKLKPTTTPLVNIFICRYMEPCFSIYTFICCCQPALFILSLSLNKHLVCRIIELIPATKNIAVAVVNNTTNNDSSLVAADMVADVESVNLDLSVGLCCSMACVFGILYIMVRRTNEKFSFLYLHDDNSAETMVEEGGDGTGVQCLEMGRVVFWAFIFTHSYMFSIDMSSAHDIEHLQVQIMSRFISIWILCRTGHSMRGKAPGYLALCLYIYWTCKMQFGASLSSVWWQKSILICIQNAWDVMLFYGHMGDKYAMACVVLNCRVCYIALTCTTLFGLVALPT